MSVAPMDPSMSPAAAAPPASPGGAPPAAPGGAPAQQDPAAAHFTSILRDPAFQKMPPDARANLIHRQIAQFQAQAKGGPGAPAPDLTPMAPANDHAFASSLVNQDGSKPFGLGKLAKAPAAPVAAASTPAAPAAHPLAKVLADPTADHAAALQKYVFG